MQAHDRRHSAPALLLALAACQAPSPAAGRPLDWLIDPAPYRAELRVSADELVLTNVLPPRGADPAEAFAGLLSLART